MKKHFYRVTIILIFLLTGPLNAAHDGSATAYFDEGASLFIQGKSKDALHEVVTGLSNHPNDFYLERLKQAIEQQQQQEGGDESQEGEGEEPQDGDEGEQESPGEEDPEIEKTSEGGEEEDQASSSEGDKDGQKPGSEEDAVQKMTPEEAAILLNAMREEEMADRESTRIILGKPIHVDKDW